MLARFSEANQALVSENERLRGSTGVIQRDYAALLGEVEGLTRKMGALEAKVMGGGGAGGRGGY